MSAKKSSKSSQYKRSAVLILGMHRSGTSALGSLLDALGLDGPQTKMPGTRDNPDGYFESIKTAKLNDRILASAESSWDDYRKIPESWIESPKSGEFYEEISNLIDDEYPSSRFFYIKDPRICRLLPIWKRSLTESKTSASFILTHRNPIEVASSLYKRDSISFDCSNFIWLRHALEAEKETRGLKRSFTSYDMLMRDPLATVYKLSEDLNLSWPRLTIANSREISDRANKSYRHHTVDHNAAVSSRYASNWVRTTHEILEKWASYGEDREDYPELDRILSEFNNAVDLLGSIDLHVTSKNHILQEKEENDISSLKTELEKQRELTKKASLQYTQISEQTSKTLKDLEGQRNLASARAVSLEADLKNMIEELETEKDRNSSLTNEFQARFQEQQRLKQELEEKLERSLKERSDLEHQLAEQTDQLTDARAKTDAAENRLKQLRAEREDLSQANSHFERENSDLSSEISNLKAFLQSEKARIEALEEELKSVRSSIESSEAKSKETLKETTRLQKEVITLSRLLLDAQTRIAERGKQISEYKIALDEQLSEIVNARSQIDDLLSSTSWKITKPLRSVKLSLQRLKFK